MDVQSVTINCSDSLSRETLVKEMDNLVVAAHRLYVVAIGLGKLANEPDMVSLNQAAGCAAIAAFNAHAMRMNLPVPFVPPVN